MNSAYVKALEKARKAVEKLEKEMSRNLSSLPKKLGFDSMADFIAALQEIDGGSGSGSNKRGRPDDPSKSSSRKRKGGKVTAEIGRKAEKMFEAHKTAREVAEAVGLSLPTVNLIKKRLGLVNKRKDVNNMPEKEVEEDTKKVPLDQLSYESFKSMAPEEIFEKYESEINNHAEWICREQDRGGPTYSLEQCIEIAKEELMNGLWGPASHL